jgi:hypothetical protein
VVNFEVQIMCNFLNQTVCSYALYDKCGNMPLNFYLFLDKVQTIQTHRVWTCSSSETFKAHIGLWYADSLECVACDRVAYIALC